MYDTIVWTHAAFGFAGILGAILAVSSRLITSPHTIHIWSGRLFTLGMVGVGTTGLVIAWHEQSIFFLSLAFFVLYLAVMGYRYAVDRAGLEGSSYRAIYVILFMAFVVMAGAGGYLLTTGDGAGILMAVFGTIGILHTVIDVRAAFGSGLKGRYRIAAHISRMLGGTIAALTAFLLIQFQSGSPLVWLALHSRSGTCDDFLEILGRSWSRLAS